MSVLDLLPFQSGHPRYLNAHLPYTVLYIALYMYTSANSTIYTPLRATVPGVTIIACLPKRGHLRKPLPRSKGLVPITSDESVDPPCYYGFASCRHLHHVPTLDRTFLLHTPLTNSRPVTSIHSHGCRYLRNPVGFPNPIPLRPRPP